jgi:hypothetical protein
MTERVVDGATGFIAKDEVTFADRAVELLTNDSLWRQQHEAALRLQRSWHWEDAAKEFVRIALEQSRE